MKMINRSSIPDQFIEKMITHALDSYHQTFSMPKCAVEIMVCKGKEDLKKQAEDYTGERGEFREYDGNFLCPRRKGDSFRILLVAKEQAVKGAQIYFSELENGSRRDDDMPQSEREKRGIDLAGYCHFVEMLQHEYSHLCSFEKLMEKTSWEDPDIGKHSMDYHLYDEMIARYRGTYAMLRMMDDFIERDLLYTLWMTYWQDTLDAFKSEKEIYQHIINQNRDLIEDSIITDMKEHGMSGEDAVFEMELELGHPLEYDGELTKKGVPKLSPVEVVEFLMFDDFGDEELNEKSFRRGIPLLYFAHNSYASYQGAQIAGLVHAFYDFLSDREGRTLDLLTLMAKPYYNTVDVAELKAELEQFTDLMMKRK